MPTLSFGIEAVWTDNAKKIFRSGYIGKLHRVKNGQNGIRYLVRTEAGHETPPRHTLSEAIQDLSDHISGAGK